MADSLTSERQKELNEGLINACAKGDVTKAAALLADGANVNYMKEGGATPLINAAWFGRKDIVEFLISRRADPFLKDKDGTAFESALLRGHCAIAALLRERMSGLSPDRVIFIQSYIGGALEEIFDFSRLERLSTMYGVKSNVAQGMTITGFSQVEDQSDTSLLRKAFNEHIRRGGKTPENLVFKGRLPKLRLTSPAPKT